MTPALEILTPDAPEMEPAAESQVIAAPYWLAGTLALLRLRWWWIALAVLVALVLAVAWLRVADYRYTAQLRVAPAPTSARENASLGALSSLASLTGTALDPIPVTPFRLYVEGIHAREVANRLAGDPRLMRAIFASEWDPVARRWQDPAGIVTRTTNGFYLAFGIPVTPWRAPDAARLHEWIKVNVNFGESPKSPIATLSMESTDPALARLLLLRLHDTVDSWLRARTLARTRSNIAYLRERLPTLALAEHRQAVLATLSDQQQRELLARNPSAYAAETFGPITVSDRPTSPRQTLVLMLAISLGAIVGLLLAVLVPPRSARRRY